MRKTVKEKGATLIELLLYLALLSIILGVIVNLIFTSGQIKQEAETNTFVSSDAAYLTKRLSYEIRNASALSTPGTLGQTTNSLVLTVNGETHTFSINSTNLQFDKLVGAVTTLANLNSNQVKVSNFSVQKLGNALGKSSLLVNFTLTSTKTGQTAPVTKTYNFLANLR